MGDGSPIQWLDQPGYKPAWTTELVSRFWSYVRVGAPDECWEWQGGRFARGYGQFRFGNKKVKAHRCAWELANRRDLHPGLRALHRCDNPPCCNPAHLFEGTNADNTRDMIAKGRSRLVPGTSMPGASNPAAKITAAVVLEIRRRAATGELQRSIAGSLGLSQSQIGNIVRGRSWQDGPWPEREA